MIFWVFCNCIFVECRFCLYCLFMVLLIYFTVCVCSFVQWCWWIRSMSVLFCPDKNISHRCCMVFSLFLIYTVLFATNSSESMRRHWPLSLPLRSLRSHPSGPYLGVGERHADLEHGHRGGGGRGGCSGENHVSSSASDQLLSSYSWCFCLYFPSAFVWNLFSF